MDIQEYMDSDLIPEEIKASRREMNRLVKLAQLLQRKEKILYDAIEAYNDSRDVVEIARDDYLLAVRRAVKETGCQMDEFSMELPGYLMTPDNSLADSFSRNYDLLDVIQEAD